MISTKEIAVVLVFMLVMLSAISILSVLRGVDIGERDVRREAIKVGAAKWVSDEDGEPKFEWVIKGEDR